MVEKSNDRIGKDQEGIVRIEVCLVMGTRIRKARNVGVFMRAMASGSNARIKSAGDSGQPCLLPRKIG